MFRVPPNEERSHAGPRASGKQQGGHPALADVIRWARVSCPKPQQSLRLWDLAACCLMEQSLGLFLVAFYTMASPV